MDPSLRTKVLECRWFWRMQTGCKPMKNTLCCLGELTRVGWELSPARPVHHPLSILRLLAVSQMVGVGDDQEEGTAASLGPVTWDNIASLSEECIQRIGRGIIREKTPSDVPQPPKPLESQSSIIVLGRKYLSLSNWTEILSNENSLISFGIGLRCG